MISLFYIAFLVSVSSLPIKLLPKRNVNQSFVGLKTFDYWLSANNVKSGDLENDDFCGDGMLAMPKTNAAIAAITAMLESTAPELNTQTWNGKYAWLGAKKWSDANAWSWLDGTPVQVHNWDTNEPGSSGSSGSLSYQPFLGLVREHGNIGKWHDFHGQDQGDNGKEASVGQVAVCQSRPQYWLTDNNVPSTALGMGDEDDLCGWPNGELAKPKSKKEQERVFAALCPGGSLDWDDSSAWGGNYVWLGGYRPEGVNQKWRWSDAGGDGTRGTPIAMSGSALLNYSRWDTNEPGHSEGGTAFGQIQRFFGVKRANGKWHDFHGQDQGNSGKEATVGFRALCQSRHA